MQPPKDMPPAGGFSSILFAFIFAIVIIFLLMKFDLKIILRLWFFVVVLVALAITANTLTFKLFYSEFISLFIAFPFAFYKVFKRNLLIHNITELFIYPGIAAVFVPILNLWVAVLLLVLISVYDIYAVWYTGFMQKMAKFQMNKVRVFAGFFVPYIDKKQRQKIRLLKQKYKNKKNLEKNLKKTKIKVNLAILGGGDIVFPIILAGVILNTLGLIPALIVSVFATSALLFLQIVSKKGKFYPAMPFISAGCLFGLFVGYSGHLLNLF